MLKEGFGHDYAVTMVQKEVEQYKKGLEHNHTKYKIVDETEQPDGSIIVKVIKQYNSSPVGDYLDWCFRRRHKEKSISVDSRNALTEIYTKFYMLFVAVSYVW